jgi:predicted dehydrogenase
MAKTYKVGIVGFGHMHVNDVAEEYAELPNVQWVACSDTVPAVPETSEAMYTRAWNRRNVMQKFGVPRFYEDYREMFAKEPMDLVIVMTENSAHADVVEAAAARGVNVQVEKPMADSMPNALRMATAVRNAGVMMAVNWPSTWMAPVQKAKELVEAGAIGQIHQLRFRGGHTGPLSHLRLGTGEGSITAADLNHAWWHRAGTGGGPLLDYCSYTACLSRWFFGEPATAVVGMAANLGSPFSQIEDNVALLIRYPAQLAIAEGSWTTVHPGVTRGPFIYGSAGTLVVEEKDGKAVVRLSRNYTDPPEYFEGSLPAGRQNVAQEVIHHFETGEPLHPTLEVGLNLDAMGILDAGIRSVKSGKTEMVNSEHWCIG